MTVTYLSANIPKGSHVILRVPQLNVVGLVQGEQNPTGIEGKVGQGAVLNKTN
jgi:hypothetical protein